MAEIEVLLAQAGITNPDTGRPYSHGTINNDLKALRQQWHEHAMADMTEHKARQLAELLELRREAWRDKNSSEVRQGLALEMKLLGTAAPEKVEQTGTGTVTLRVVYDERIDGEDAAPSLETAADHPKQSETESC